MMADDLTITRGQAQMDAGLIEVGLDEYQRLAGWEAALNAMIEQVSGTNLDLGLAEIIAPGNYLLLGG